MPLKSLWIGASAGLSISMVAPAQAQTRQFNLPEQEASTGIPAFAKQAELQIIAPADALANVRMPAIQGTMDTQTALQRVIAATGLEMASNKGGVVVLRRVQPKGASSTPGVPGAAATSVAVGGPTADSGPTGGDIVVTAQRRAERQQTVPISLTVLDARAISRYRINALEDVSRLTPGLLVSTFSPGRPVIAIRGATNTFNAIGVDKPVGVFVDDVYIPNNGASTLELFGISSIQVLKGPQGTLFGRNVTGGAIVVDTGRPAFDSTQAALRASYGEYNTRELDALVDVPLSAGTAIRVAGLLRRHDGWGRDRLSGQEFDDQDSKAVRGQFRSRLTDRLELLVGGDYSTDKSGGRTLSSKGVGNDGNRRTAELGVPQSFRREQGGISGRLFWDTGTGEITNITAWRKSNVPEVNVNVGANFTFLTGTQSQAIVDDRTKVTTFSEEVRFTSPTWKAGNFILGAYYSSQDSTRLLFNTALAAKTGVLVMNQLVDQATNSRSFALFGDGTINFTPFLSASLGGRYTWDRKRAAVTRTDFFAPATNYSDSNVDFSSSQFTPRAVLKLQPTRDLLVYASYARGYTAGGLNTEAATAAILRTPFQAETVTNYEVGLKSEWFNRRLRFNISAFQMKYTDKQELFFNNSTRVLNITNAARATTKGIEVDTSIHPTNWFTLSATYGLLDTRYDQYVIPGGAVNTGNRLGSSPRYKASVTADVDVPVGTGRVFGSAVYSMTSTYNTGAAADPNLVIAGYSLVNGTVGYAFPGNRFQISAFVRNAFNKDYVLIPGTQVILSEYLGAPRIIGATVSARF